MVPSPSFPQSMMSLSASIFPSVGGHVFTWYSTHPSYRLIAKPLPTAPTSPDPLRTLLTEMNTTKSNLLLTPVSFAPRFTISSTGLVILLLMTSGSPLPNLPMLLTLSLPSMPHTPLPRPHPPLAPPPDVVGVVVKRGATFYFSLQSFPLENTTTCTPLSPFTRTYLVSPLLHTMSNNVTSAVP